MFTRQKLCVFFVQARSACAHDRDEQSTGSVLLRFPEVHVSRVRNAPVKVFPGRGPFFLQEQFPAPGENEQGHCPVVQVVLCGQTCREQGQKSIGPVHYLHILRFLHMPGCRTVAEIMGRTVWLRHNGPVVGVDEFLKGKK
jgi:hypothetical protein